MYFGFLAELRRHKVPVGAHEAVALAAALKAGLHDSSLDGFYHVARALLVHSETQLDPFDRAFDAHFRGAGDAGTALSQQLLDWLVEAATREDLSEAERLLLEQFSPEALEAMLQERLATQKERHDGGNHWIGTGGTSPFGHSGRVARPGIRVGGPGGRRSAIRSIGGGGGWEAYRDDVVLDVRQLSVALRRLRAFARDGGEPELDVDETIAATAKNAGELEVRTRPPRRPNTRVVLLMDVGGSMDPHALLVSRLFSAAKKATHFKDLKTYYFHNCVYGRLYVDAEFSASISVNELLLTASRQTKLVVVGDAMMAPYELTVRGGGVAWNDPDAVDGLTWLARLVEHFQKAAWLNPEPEVSWNHPTVDAIRRVFGGMYPLTLQGLGEAVEHLTRGASTRR